MTQGRAVVIEAAAQLPTALGSGGGMKVDDAWRSALTSSETANDSDITFTVTASQEWQLQSIWVELVTTADVGNRQISVVITDAADDVLARIDAGTTQAASLTRNYLFAVGVSDLLGFRNTLYLMTPLVPWVLPAGYKIRVYDSAAVQAAADDMVIQMMYAYRAV
ncbi:MAG: hypothetical protein WC565_05040 [Parcubacteria group bacterium]